MENFNTILENLQTLIDNSSSNSKDLVEEKIKSYIDKKIYGISEQNVGVLGVSGFPLSPSLTQQPSVQSVQTDTNGIVLDLDVLQSEIQKATGLPDVQPKVELQQSVIVPKEPEQKEETVEDIQKSDVNVETQSNVSNDNSITDEELISRVDKDSVEKGNLKSKDEEENGKSVAKNDPDSSDGKFELTFDEDDEKDDEDDDKDKKEDEELEIALEDEDLYAILNRRRKFNEEIKNQNKVVSDLDVFGHLSKVEKMYTSILESVEFSSVSMIQETLRENKTLRDVVKKSLADGHTSASKFAGIFELSLKIEENLLEQLHIYNQSPIITIDESDDFEENPETDVEELVERLSVVLETTLGDEIMKKENLNNDECNLHEMDEPESEVSVTNDNKDDTTIQDNEEGQMDDNQVVEVDEKELQEAIKRFKLRRSSKLAEAANGAGEPNTPPEPKVRKKFGDAPAHLEDSNVAEPVEVDPEDLAKTSDLKIKTFEALNRKLAFLENALKEKDQLLKEAKLQNQKIMYAWKLNNNSSLTNDQKSKIAKQLKEAKTAREAELVYTTISESLEGGKAINENRTRPGASSRVTTSGSTSTSLNENAGSARWKVLAGIKTK